MIGYIYTAEPGVTVLLIRNQDLVGLNSRREGY